MFWRTHHTKPDPKPIRVMPLCLWGVQTRLDLDYTSHGLICPLLLGAGAHVCCRPFRVFAGGRKACRFFGVASGCFVKYILLLPFWRSAKKSTVWTSLRKSSKEKEQIEVKLLTSKKLYISL